MPAETTIRERLKDVDRLRERIAKMYDRLENMDARLSTPSSPSWERIGRDGTPKHDRLAERIAEKIDFERKIEQLVSELNTERRELEKIFEQLEPDQELVCCLRYVDGLSWPQTVAAMYDSKDHFEENIDAYTNRAFKAHGLALRTLDKLTAGEE